MHLCFLVLAKVCAKVFIKKEVVCLILAFIDNICFSITQPSNSVNMTLSAQKTNVGLLRSTDSKNPFPRRVIRIEHSYFLFGLNKAACKNQKDVTPLSFLAKSLVLNYLKLPFQRFI